MIGKGNGLRERAAFKYDSYHFWENLIHKEASLWENGFQNLPLTRQSIFIYTVVMDHEKGFLKNRWAFYPDAYALLGFIQYVFLPTAYFTWLDQETEGFNIPLAKGEQVLEVMGQLDPNLDSAQMELMKGQLEEIKALWDLPEAGCLEKLQEFTRSFNQAWQGQQDKVVYFKTFQTPVEIGEFILQGGDQQEPCFTEVIEEEIEMTAVQWRSICQKVYEDPFIRKKFIDMLNYKIGCLV